MSESSIKVLIPFLTLSFAIFLNVSGSISEVICKEGNCDDSVMSPEVHQYSKSSIENIYQNYVQELEQLNIGLTAAINDAENGVSILLSLIFKDIIQKQLDNFHIIDLTSFHFETRIFHFRIQLNTFTADSIKVDELQLNIESLDFHEIQLSFELSVTLNNFGMRVIVGSDKSDIVLAEKIKATINSESFVVLTGCNSPNSKIIQKNGKIKSFTVFVNNTYIVTKAIIELINSPLGSVTFKELINNAIPSLIQLPSDNKEICTILAPLLKIHQ
jgi:hypothetical protein